MILDGVEHVGRDALAGQRAGVADLAAALAVERRLVEDDEALVAGGELVDHLAALDQRGDDAFGGLGFVAEELGRADLVGDGEPDLVFAGLAGAGPALAGLGALLGHRILEAREVDIDAARAQRVLRQVEREAVGVVELEGGDALEHVALA